jgi:CDP-glucose 4,6-dehydratase
VEEVVSDSLAKVFAKKRVLVTGHTGFKGSWLTLWLRELGAEVTGYALAPEYEGSHFERLGLAGEIEHVVADIRDADRLKAVVSKARPEVVFHLAAQALVRRSYDDPKTTFDTNVGGSVNLLDAVRATPEIRALVYITSDKAYLNKEWPWGYR